jgi:hypothetical protein
VETGGHASIVRRTSASRSSAIGIPCPRANSLVVADPDHTRRSAGRTKQVGRLAAALGLLRIVLPTVLSTDAPGQSAAAVSDYNAPDSYVAPGGNHANDGSAADPFRYLAEAGISLALGNVAKASYRWATLVGNFEGWFDAHRRAAIADWTRSRKVENTTGIDPI